MDKMNYDHGLVRYATEHELGGGKTHWLRPRLVGYGVAMVVMCIAFTYALTHRSTVEAKIARDRGALFHETKRGDIENTYTLTLFNKTSFNEIYEVNFQGHPSARLIGPASLELAPGQTRVQIYQVQIAPDMLANSRLPISFIIEPAKHPENEVTIESSFIGPDRWK
jgi:polyferredoxin